MGKKKTVNPHRLRNLVDRRELERRLVAEPFARTTVSFYRYVQLSDLENFRHSLWAEWNELGVFGRVYIAEEGINAQISIPEHNVEKFRGIIDANQYFSGVPFKVAVEDDGKSFIKLDIKVRKKLVADGLDDASFDVTNVGEHLSAEKFNELLQKPETVCVDMRNNYESRIGHFENAVCPEAETFRDELPEVLEKLKDKPKDEPVILYCTGGIRCEKASAFLKHHGFRNVGQLHGGIIDYAHQVKREGLENKFRGKNFVFDGRRAETIGREILSKCDICEQKSDTYINCANVGCNELLLSCADCQGKLNGCCSEDCQIIHALPEDQQRELRKGKKNFKKLRTAN